MMRVGVREAIVDGQVVPGDVEIDGDRVVAVGVQPAGGGGTAVAGFVDLQVNGFDGVDFLTADDEGYRTAGESLAATGVTAYQPTFICSPLSVYRPALAQAGDAMARVAGPRVLGVHLEGPFLSPRWPGAHDPANIVDPDPRLAAELTASGVAVYMTLAPERPGGLELVVQMVAAGVVVSCGHTDADAATAHAAYDRGARAVTHLYNAQRRWQPRDPGVGGAALVRGDVTVQAIVDGLHLAPETALQAYLAARGRFALVTDAVEAARREDGRYRLGDRDVIVADGAARLADGTLAGSVLTMDEAVRNLVALGVPLVEALAAASSVPARLIGRPDLGVLRPGLPADVAVLDEGVRVRRTLVAGVEAYAG
jgi:N-acetylglucosamine-6-phosphate deacetylase